MTECLTQINNKRDSISSGIVLISFCKPLAEKSWKKELPQYQQMGTEVDARTVELYSKQGNTDIKEHLIIDEMTQCEICDEHHARVESFCKCGQFCQGYKQDMKETLVETTKQVRISQSREHRI